MMDRPRRTILVLDDTMNPQKKQGTQRKIDIYMKRAKELSDIMKNGAPKKRVVTDDDTQNGIRSNRIAYLQVE